MGENHFESLPSALYGFNLFMAAIAYSLLQTAIRHHDKQSLLAHALQHDYKGIVSPLLYLCAIGAAFYLKGLSQLIYIVVALMWLVPDRRIEKNVTKAEESAE